MADLVVAGFTGKSLVVVSFLFSDANNFKNSLVLLNISFTSLWSFKKDMRYFLIESISKSIVNSQVKSPSSPNPGVSISLEVKPATLNGLLLSSSQFTLRLDNL